MRLLLWLAGRQRRLLGIGIIFGILWMVAQAAVPAALGRGVQAVADDDLRAVAQWAGVVLALGVLQAFAGIHRHRYAVTSWIAAASRIQQLVARKASDLGGDLPRQVSTGEVVAVSANDVERIGNAMELTMRLAGAIVAFVCVATVLLIASPLLGAVVLVGVPLVALSIGPLVRPLENRESIQRERFGEATELAADTVMGLRVLRGIGGEELFLQRFHEASDAVRTAAVRTARVRSILDALQVLLPGAFVVAVTWLGARLALSGDIEPGQLVTFYGYTAFLVLPLRTLTEGAHKWTAAFVAARRVVRVLSLQRGDTGGEVALGAPDTWGLVDEQSGFRARRGALTALVSDDSERASRLLDRLGGYATPLDAEQRAAVRAQVLVQDKDPVLFAGRLANTFVVPTDGLVSVESALQTADATEIIDGLPEGLETELPERARSLSGGQRQRIALARSLVADPPTLLLDEPTSAVDAHTESRIAERLAAARAGRTTVVVTTSPLVLDRADEVQLLRGGMVVATGTHRDLVRGCDEYRRTVLRGVDD
ncbi:MAG: ABC transporter ATP-binding protein [Candidatus Nanopelagicales bacterium]